MTKSIMRSTMSGRAANRNPAQADPYGLWWGSAAGRFYACHGNTLTGRNVIFAMAQAYEETPGTLADRLVAALAAGIRIARTGAPGYTLELYVDQSDDAVNDLAQEYAALTHDANSP